MIIIESGYSSELSILILSLQLLSFSMQTCFRHGLRDRVYARGTILIRGHSQVLQTNRHSSWLIHRSTDLKRDDDAARRQSEVARFRTLIFAFARVCNPLRSNRWASLIRSVRSGLPLCLNRCQFVTAWRESFY